MCSLCSRNPTEHAAAIHAHAELAERFERLAVAYRDMAHGHIGSIAIHSAHNPRTQQMARDVAAVHAHFVDEWGMA